MQVAVVISLLLTTVVGSSKAVAMCADLVSKPRHGRALFTHYEMEAQKLITSTGNSKRLASQKRVKEFWQKAWPALVDNAKSNGVHVYEMFEEPLILVKLFVFETTPPSKDLDFLAILYEGLIKDLKALELMKPRGKLKATHWTRIHAY